MKVRGFKRACMIALLVFTEVSLSACQQMMLNNEEEELIVDYAVNAVIKHDKNYIIKLQDVSEPTTPIETTWWKDGSNNSNSNGEQSTSSDKNNSAQIVSVNQAFGLAGFDVTYVDYVVTDQYPNDSQTLGFNMIAIEGFDLLVTKFNVTNNTSETVNLDMLSKSLSFKGIIDANTKVNAQITGLLDAFNTWKGDFGAGETKQLVLVFQVSEDITSSFTLLQLAVSNGGSTSITQLN